ncbi:MAG: peptide-methionine (S)-S-oxide reductase MsrA [Vulcanimicrobiaceae bacterium]
MNRSIARLAMTIAATIAVVGLVPRPTVATPASIVAPVFGPHRATAVLAGGCFWGLEDVFAKLRGVTNVVVGYSGGERATARYDLVSSGSTGHAESVAISFDPTQISYAKLLDVFFSVAHDPTEVDRQGPDEGPQYRSVVYYANGEQAGVARAAVAKLTAAHTGKPIATKVVPLRTFYAAEAYHQHFAERNPTYPYIVEVDAPKVTLLEARFPQLVRGAH